MRTSTHTRGARTALVLGSALAAPAVFVGVASAVSPTPAESPPRALTPPPVSESAPRALTVTDADVDVAQAFWDAGYQYCDAQALAEAHEGDVWQSKLAVGNAIRNGAAVAPPTGCVDEIDGVSTLGSADLDAFWDAGYRYCDAEALAASLGAGDPYETKAAIGAAVISGADVPAPSGCTS